MCANYFSARLKKKYMEEMKKMDKKKVLGIPLTIFIIGLIVIGGASAALVSYLSNTATMNVEVDSPVSIEFAEVAHGATVVTAIDNVADSGVVWADNLVTGSTTGLSTLELGVKLVNKADVSISNKVLAVTLSNDLLNVDCDDLTSLTFVDVGASPGTTYYRVVQELVGVGLCVDNGVDVTYSIPINSLGAEQTFKYPVTMTFGNVAPATYSANGVLLI